MFGTLRSEAATYPIVAGIPILTEGHDDLVELLREDAFDRAVARAAIDVPAAGAWRIGDFLSQTYRFRELGQRIDRTRRQRIEAKVIEHLTSPEVTARDLFELAYCDLNLRSIEVFNYNYFRHGIPRHVTPLALIDSIREPSATVIDVGCGAGHLTRMLRTPQGCARVIGLDGFFFSLYVARRFIDPGGAYVCGYIDAMPFPEALFDVVFASDFFSFPSRKVSTLREMERVLHPDGSIMMSCLRNALVEHLYAGRPLTPAGYRDLVSHLDYRLISDHRIVQRFLHGKGVPLAEDVDDDSLRSDESFSLVARRRGKPFVDAPDLDRWPQRTGFLGVNPLYQHTGTSPDGTRIFDLRMPSDHYAEENKGATYLPRRFDLTDTQYDALMSNDAGPLEESIKKFAVIGMPPRYAPVQSSPE